jgi:hypothetical protein
MVTAVAYSPHDPNVIVAGTKPAALFRSEDGGKAWRNLNAAMYESVALRFGSKDSNNNPTATIAPTSPDDPVKHWTRVCQIVWDYDDPEMVCACVEIDDAISRMAGSFQRSQFTGSPWRQSPAPAGNATHRWFAHALCYDRVRLARQHRRRRNLAASAHRLAVAIHPLDR